MGVPFLTAHAQLIEFPETKSKVRQKKNLPVSIDSVLSRVMTSPSANDHFAAWNCQLFCFKLFPKFAYYAQTMPITSGRSNLVLALLCCVRHNFIKRGLGIYWEIYTSRLHVLPGIYLSYHVRTLSPGPATSMHGTRYFIVRDWDTETVHSLRIRLPVYLGHYAQEVPIIPA